MEKWDDFLKKMAVDYSLTSAEIDVFLKQFSEKNIGKQKTRSKVEFAGEFNIAVESYTKYKTEIFKKFNKEINKKNDGCEFSSKGPGKLLELEKWLQTQYDVWILGTQGEKNIKCPYKGLSAFTKDDARFFFGREKFTASLVQAVQRQPFVAVIGNSGSGKSSVVYAGLIPELEQKGKWQFIIFRPTNNPFFQLANALLPLLEHEMDKLECLAKSKKYANNFKTGELTLKEVLDDSLQKNLSNQRVLIFVDQFEEVYTLCPEDEKKAFIDQLLEVVQAESEKRTPDVVLVITLRADFYWHAIAYQPLGEVLQKWKQETILAMNESELQSAIEQPAKVVGLTIQESLIKIILDAVKRNPGELPLLEFCLEQLWQKQSNSQLTIATYNEIGGVEKALANHAEEIYQKLHEDEQNRVQHIFTQLVRFGENTDATRRIATREQIGAENWQLVTDLANAEARLVVTGKDAKQQPTVEVVHEALIRGWDRLREWMEEYEEFRKWQDRLRAEKDSWENSGKDNGALLRGALLVEAEDWLKKRKESIRDQEEREFILASRQYQEQEDIERIEELLNLSQQELQLKEQLKSLVIAVKAGVKLCNIKEPSENLKKKIIERLQQSSYCISERNQLVSHEGEINTVTFSPDGLNLASGSDDNTIRLWNLDGKLVHLFEGHADEVLQVNFSPDGQTIASASVDKTVKLWNLLDGTYQDLEGHTKQVCGVIFSPDGKTIASASEDGIVKLWNLFNGTYQDLEGHEIDKFLAVSFSWDGQIVAAAGNDKTVKLWNLNTGSLNTLYENGCEARVNALSFSPNDYIIASAHGEDSIIRLWDINLALKIKEKTKKLEGHNDRILGVSFSPDGQTIASASADKTVKLWSIDGALLRTLEGHKNRVLGVSFSPDGQTIASASEDRSVRLWSLDGKFVRKLEEPEKDRNREDRISGVSFSPDGQTIASAHADKTVKLWRDGKFWKKLEGHKYPVSRVSFSPDGKIIASASDDKTVKLWISDDKFETIKIITLAGHEDKVQGVSFSPNGKIIVSASHDGTVKVWNLDDTSFKTRHIKAHEERVLRLSFSPDGKMIASASEDKTVKLWNLDGTLSQTIEGHKERVWGVSFSPDGKMIASGGDDRNVKLWSLDGKLLRTLKGHEDRVWEVSFSPDTKTIASASADRTVKLWSLDDGTLLRTLEGHTDRVLGVSFSPNGQFIASGSWDKTIRLWPIDSEDLILDLDVKLNNLLKKGCNWIRDYLKTNPNVSESDRHLCDHICP